MGYGWGVQRGEMRLAYTQQSGRLEVTKNNLQRYSKPVGFQNHCPTQNYFNESSSFKKNHFKITDHKQHKASATDPTNINNQSQKPGHDGFSVPGEGEKHMMHWQNTSFSTGAEEVTSAAKWLHVGTKWNLWQAGTYHRFGTASSYAID